VAKPDTSNAQIRKPKSRRESPDLKAQDAQRLLDDPAFVRAYNAVRDGLIAELEGLKHDGSESMLDYESEICRTLRTLKSVKRAIALGVQGQQLRLADFRPVQPEKD
jgi:hypothetical protein